MYLELFKQRQRLQVLKIKRDLIYDVENESKSISNLNNYNSKVLQKAAKPLVLCRSQEDRKYDNTYLLWLFSNPARLSSVKDVSEAIVFFSVLVILDDIPYPLIPPSVKL